MAAPNILAVVVHVRIMTGQQITIFKDNIMKKFILFIIAILVSVININAQDTIPQINDTFDIIETTGAISSSIVYSVAIFMAVFCTASLLMHISFYRTFRYNSFWDEIRGHSLVNCIFSFAILLISLLLIIII